MLDTGYWILDTGYWILDTGYWILDTGYKVSIKIQKSFEEIEAFLFVLCSESL
jgi:hypothetical protein